MSKSLNNFLTIDDVTKSYDSNAIRFFILTNHYRMPVEFNDVALNSAKTGVNRLLSAAIGFVDTKEYDDEAIQMFKEAMDNDLNTSKALAILFSLADKIKKNENAKTTQISANTLIMLSNVLGFNFEIVNKEISDELIQNKRPVLI